MGFGRLQTLVKCSGKYLVVDSYYLRLLRRRSFSSQWRVEKVHQPYVFASKATQSNINL